MNRAQNRCGYGYGRSFPSASVEPPLEVVVGFTKLTCLEALAVGEYLWGVADASCTNNVTQDINCRFLSNKAEVFTLGVSRRPRVSRRGAPSPRPQNNRDSQTLIPKLNHPPRAQNNRKFNPKKHNRNAGSQSVHTPIFKLNLNELKDWR
jgi:hypothetical protein